MFFIKHKYIILFRIFRVLRWFLYHVYKIFHVARIFLTHVYYNIFNIFSRTSIFKERSVDTFLSKLITCIPFSVLLNTWNPCILIHHENSKNRRYCISKVRLIKYIFVSHSLKMFHKQNKNVFCLIMLTCLSYQI